MWFTLQIRHLYVSIKSFEKIQLLKQAIVKEKVDNPNVQNSVIIIPSFPYIMAHDDFGEGIAGQGKWFHFSIGFRWVFHSVGRLNIYLFSASGRNKVNLAGCSYLFSLFIPAV